jgi:hypothetical protein
MRSLTKWAFDWGSIPQAGGEDDRESRNPKQLRNGLRPGSLRFVAHNRGKLRAISMKIALARGEVAKSIVIPTTIPVSASDPARAIMTVVAVSSLMPSF